MSPIETINFSIAHAALVGVLLRSRSAALGALVASVVIFFFRSWI